MTATHGEAASESFPLMLRRYQAGPALYNFFLPAALIFAQRALAIAESFFLAAGLILLLVFGVVFVPLTFAQRALAAADIFAFAAALIVNFFLGAAGAVAFVDAPTIRSSSFSRDWILSFSAAAFRNCEADRLMIEFMSQRNTNFDRDCQ
jgi:hypothetical protein